MWKHRNLQREKEQVASHEQHSSRVKIRHSPWFCAAFSYKEAENHR